MKDYCLSQDLGRLGDYHAQCLTKLSTEERSRTLYSRQFQARARVDMIYPKITVVWLGRSQVPYPDLGDETILRLQDPKIVGNCYHVLDATGVGMPVIEYMWKNKLRPVGIWLHGGDRTNVQDYGKSVPKKDVVEALNFCLNARLLTFARGLDPKIVEVLKHEFQNFKEKVRKTGTSSFEAWREKDHDDLVLAVGINCWYVLREVRGIHEFRRSDARKETDYNPLRDGL